MKINKIATLFIIINFNILCFSQSFNAYFENIGKKDGLPQISVNVIFQDDQGFVWLGTQEGLTRFDGYSFHTFKHDPENVFSIADNSIWSIVRENERFIWVASNGGISRFDTYTERFLNFRSSPDKPDSLSDNNVRALCFDNNNVLWIGTRNGGLNKLMQDEGESFIIDRFSINKNTPFPINQADIRAIILDKNSNLWVGTYGFGVFKLNVNNVKNSFVQYIHDNSKGNTLIDNKVLSLMESQNGNIWIGTENGLSIFDTKSQTFSDFVNIPGETYSLSHNSIWCLNQDLYGNIWIGTNGGGLNKYIDSGKFVHYSHESGNDNSLSGNDVRALLCDRQGLLWIGTYGSGLNKLDQSTRAFSLLRNNPSDSRTITSNIILTIFEDRNRHLWIGTWNGGLNYLNLDKSVKKSFRANSNDASSLSINTVWAIHEDSNSDIWIGTWGGGLNRLKAKERDKQNPRIEHFLHDSEDDTSLGNNSILSIKQCSRNYLWIATWGGGLNRLDLSNPLKDKLAFKKYKNDKSNPHSISDNFIKTIFEDSKGNIWLGTWGGGLNKLRAESISAGEEYFIRYQNEWGNPNTLSHNDVMVIHEDKNGTLWLGTYGGGLNRFDPVNETFRVYKDEQGLPNNSVYGILEDNNGNLWLSTNNGICCFDPENDTFELFTVRDGLQGDEFNQGAYYKNKEGTLFFGGIGGLTFFNPTSIKKNTYIPPIYFTDLSVMYHSVPIEAEGILKKTIIRTAEIDLTYEQSVFSLTFSALNYRQSEKNQYKYKMEGIDDVWVTADYLNRHVLYRNIEPGTYTFKVKASNDDGLWNENISQLKLHILPPWYKKWWVKTLFYTIIILSLISFYWLRISIMERQKRILEKKVDERTLELKKKNQEIYQLAVTDNLTGIFNRTHMAEVLERDFKNSMRHKLNLSCILMDIDHFKVINDKYGHQAGDIVLKEVASKVASTIRDGDFHCRYGGEEFLILLPDTSIEGALNLAEKIRLQIMESTFEYNGSQLKVTVSLGVSDNHIDNPENENQMMVNADKALYRAKEMGRNTICSSAETQQ